MKQQPTNCRNDIDREGNPSGGLYTATGLSISWQAGPLGSGESRREPNGTFVETVIAAALQRLQFYNSSPFVCRENALAITKLEEALHWLNHRTIDRQDRGVEGTHTR